MTEQAPAEPAAPARDLSGPWRWLVAGLGAAMVLFYFYTAGVASVATQYHRGVYVFITYILVFLLYPAGGKRRRSVDAPTLLDVLLASASAVTVGYWMHEFESLNYRAGAETELDALVSIVGVLLSLEVCRRVLGWAMTSVGLVMLAYAYFGSWLPDVIAHRGFGVERLCTALFLTTNGVFGVMASVLATYVILFIFFGAFLHKSGAGKFFIDLPMALAGRSTGGPAKVAVMASAL